jgi:hypothetical protein
MKPDDDNARLPDGWEVDYEDLGNVYGRSKIQSCTSTWIPHFPLNNLKEQN